MRILAIETSCDETGCAVVEDGTKILSNVVASSAAMHEKYGGIVPEVAARAQLECIIPVIQEAIAPLASPDHTKLGSHTTQTSTSAKSIALHSTKLFAAKGTREIIERSIDALAVTVGPGLIGSLLVGVETAKTIAAVTNKPIIPVNHVIGHMYANFVESGSGLKKPQSQTPFTFPAISLVVSGGHTELYLMASIKDIRWLGGTLDDAAGEAFDKTARLLGFGSRGGVAIERAALEFKVQSSKFKVKLPRPMLDDESLNFSFSGLKTAVMREWKKRSLSSPKVSSSGSDLKKGQTPRLAFAYEIQEAITDVLVEKTIRAAKQFGAKSILLSGGVAANIRLREKFYSKLEALGSKLSLFAPPVQLCTDNAVYVGSCAYFRGEETPWREISAQPDLAVEQ